MLARSREMTLWGNEYLADRDYEGQLRRARAKAAGVSRSTGTGWPGGEITRVCSADGEFAYGSNGEISR